MDTTGAEPKQKTRIWGIAIVITLGVMIAQALLRAALMAQSVQGDHPAARVVGLFAGLLLDPLLFIILMPLAGLGVWLARRRGSDERIKPSTVPAQQEGVIASTPTSAHGSQDGTRAREDFKDEAGKRTNPETNPKNMKSDAHRFYAQAMEELREKTVDRATFAKAYADALGDAEKTKALYVKHRADSLSMEEANLEYRQRKFRELSDEAQNRGMGSPPVQPGDIRVPEARRGAAAALAILLGWVGAHKFYMGKLGAGAVMASVGLVGLTMAGVPTFAIVMVSIYETIRYLTMSDMEFHRVYVVGRKSWF
jgi:TM2 domain-containing membrane protein YozV